MLEFLQLFRSLIFFAAYISSGIAFPEPLSPEAEKAALQAVARGDEQAKDELISHNLRLVAHVAKKYSNAGYDQDDLISIGTIGLIKAIGTYNPEKGNALATYAARCIQNEILMHLRTNKKRKAEVSINEPIGVDKEGNEITLADVMGSEVDGIIDQVGLTIEIQKLYALMSSCLTPREQLVIELRYGLGRPQALPQREVAELLDISRSYVSRLEKKALEHLRDEFDRM